MKTKKQLGLLIFIVIVLTALITWAVNNYIVYGVTDETTGKFRIATQIIQRNSYNKVTDIELQEGSIHGMVDSLNDPHSAYMTAAEVQAFENSFLSEYIGIGITTSKIIDGFMVTEVAKNSPAENADVRVYDVIKSINGEKIIQNDKTIADYLKNGSSAKTLTILRGTEEVEIIITEATVDYAQTLSQVHIVDGRKIMVFNLQRFTNKTVELLTADLEKLKDDSIESVIFDLRNNTGGEVDVAKGIIQKISSNKNIAFSIAKAEETTSKNAIESEKIIEKVTTNNPELQIKQPMLMLVNENTASAAEIVAATLNRNDGVRIVGNKTYGKSSIQELFKMNDGSAIKVTTKKWAMPDGTVLIDGEGLEPSEKSIDSLPFTISTVGAKKVYVLGDRDRVGSTTIADTQMILNYFGYDTARADGLFDNQTREQLLMFQADNGITQTGEIDTNTLIFLNKKLIAYTSDVAHDVTLQLGFKLLKN
ncbi:carboxy-terminal processing protease CtpA [Erysipelotrichaceae bacterium]|nr:carboxy-terminal processing protease CtpA [Erysipelotrichaceae bacterium]